MQSEILLTQQLTTGTVDCVCQIDYVHWCMVTFSCWNNFGTIDFCVMRLDEFCPTCTERFCLTVKKCSLSQTVTDFVPKHRAVSSLAQTAEYFTEFCFPKVYSVT